MNNNTFLADTSFEAYDLFFDGLMTVDEVLQSLENIYHQPLVKTRDEVLEFSRSIPQTTRPSFREFLVSIYEGSEDWENFVDSVVLQSGI